MSASATPTSMSSAANLLAPGSAVTCASRLKRVASLKRTATPSGEYKVRQGLRNGTAFDLVLLPNGENAT